MTLDGIQVDRVCRTCLSEEGDMQSVFIAENANLGDAMKLFEMLMSCASVEVSWSKRNPNVYVATLKVLEGDGLPGQVCVQCADFITQAFSFKQLCERSDTTLRDLLGKTIVHNDTHLEPLKPVDASFMTMLVYADQKEHKLESSGTGMLLPRE